MNICSRHRAIIISTVIFIIFFEIIFRNGIAVLEGAMVAATIIATLFLPFIMTFSIWRLGIKNKIFSILSIYISTLIAAPVSWAGIYGATVYLYAAAISVYFPLNRYLHVNIWNILLNIINDRIVPSIFSGLFFYSSMHLLNKIDRPIRLRLMLKGGACLAGSLFIFCVALLIEDRINN